jgi:hypothetical protein
MLQQAHFGAKGGELPLDALRPNGLPSEKAAVRCLSAHCLFMHNNPYLLSYKILCTSSNLCSEGEILKPIELISGCNAH